MFIRGDAGHTYVQHHYYPPSSPFFHFSLPLFLLIPLRFAFPSTYLHTCPCSLLFIFIFTLYSLLFRASLSFPFPFIPLLSARSPLSSPALLYLCFTLLYHTILPFTLLYFTLLYVTHVHRASNAPCATSGSLHSWGYDTCMRVEVDMRRST